MFPFLHLKRPSLIGLDIQSDRICLLQIRQSQRKQQIIRFAEAPIPSGIIREGKIQECEQLVLILMRLAEAIPMRDRVTAIALPNTCIINKYIQLAAGCEEEYEAEIETRLSEWLPGITQEVCFDYYIQDGDPQQIRALLIAAKNEILNAYVDAANQSGFIVKMVDIDWYASQRAITFCKDVRNKTIAFLDVGIASAQILILQNEKIVFSEQINLSADNEDLIRTVFHPLCHVIQMWSMAYRPLQIEKIYLTGKFSCLEHTLAYMRKHLNISCEIPYLLDNLSIAEEVDAEHLSTQMVHSMVSLGLALRNYPAW